VYLTSADSAAVKVTVDGRGAVWYLDGEQMPFCSGSDANEFSADFRTQTASRFRVVAFPENIPLILALYNNCSRKEEFPLEVCSPLCCEGADRQDPELLLYRMRGYGLPPSLGGWHRFGPLDLPSYLLARALHPGAGAAGDADAGLVRLYMRAHPAAVSLRFPDHLDELQLARLIAMVIDPRWFVDPHEPDSPSKLEQYLGLTPKNADDAAKGDTSWRADRCRLVKRVWDNLRDPADPNDHGPRRFVYRERRRGGAVWDLKASRLFVDYLRQTWTASVCAGPQRGRLFVPEYFFPFADEAAAYREHCSRAVGRRD
jgi:hypothetical protein